MKRIVDILLGIAMMVVGFILIINSLKVKDMFLLKMAFILFIIGGLVAAIDDKEEAVEIEE